jgi:hypothetical protein
LVDIELENICQLNSNTQLTVWETQIRCNFSDFKNSIKTDKYFKYAEKQQYIGHTFQNSLDVVLQTIKYFNRFEEFMKMANTYEKKLKKETKQVILETACLLVFYFEDKKNFMDQDLLISFQLYNEFFKSILQWQKSKLDLNW